MRRVLCLLMLAVSAGALVLAVGGCSSPEKALRARAVGFYSFLRGERPDDSYLNYLSPVRKAEITKNLGAEQLKLLASTIGGRGRSENMQLRRGRVRVQIQGHFGVSWVEGRQDEPLMQSSPVKWVLDGGSWFLFQGSEAEVQDFGEFPRELMQRQQRKPAVPKAPSQPIEEQAPDEPRPSTGH